MADKKKPTKKKFSFKDFDPNKYVNVNPVINEARKKTIVISFGRMNPITSGHEKLVNTVMKEAASRRADSGIFLSHSHDAKKNPLTYDQKIALGKKAFGRVIRRSTARTIIEVAKELSGQYDNLVVVVGSDRIAEFKRLLETYNGKEYNYETIEVVSAGERDPDSDDVSGMSASKLRSLAATGNLDEFKKGLPRKLQSSANKVYDMVRSGMGLTEEADLSETTLSLAQRRKRGLVMKRYKSKIKAARERAKRRMAPKEKLLKRSRRKALMFLRDRLMKNKKYAEMSPAEKIALDKRLERIPKRVVDRIAQRLFPKVRSAEQERLASVLSPKNEAFNEAFAEAFGTVTMDDLFEQYFEERTIKPQDPDVKDQPGSQPKGYYAGLKKSTKAARARHFRKYGDKPDDDDSAYKPAPGDATAETRPSVHTKKFKQMFGEASEADMVFRKRPHMAFEKNGSVKFDRRFKMYRKQMNESMEEINEDLVNLMMDMDAFVMSEEFDALMESNPTEALKKKAEKSGISYGILKKVYDRGVAAWKTGHRPGTTPTQWGLARVNSFATKGKGTWGKADSDLASRVRSEGVEMTKAKMRIAQEKEADRRKHDRLISAAKERDKLSRKRMSEGNPDPSKREHGTDSLVKILKGDTPGESKGIKESSPLMKNLPRGARVKFTYKTITGADEEHEGTVVGTENYPHQGSSDVVSSRGRLRIRDDEGRVYIIKHEDADLVEATKSRGFEGNTITVKNEPVRMIDGSMRRMPPGKSASSKGGNGD
jgi:nicotinic acid mononucleotide adenylyltransferase